MRTRQEGTESLLGKTCVIVKIATTGCDRAEDELLELTLLNARTRLDTPVMAPPLYFGRFRPLRHRDWPEARARNGLALSDVRDAPAPEDPRERGRIQRVLDGTGVLAGFNLPFTLASLHSFPTRRSSDLSPVSQMPRYHGGLVALRCGNGAGQPAHVARHGRSLPHRAGEGACLADGRRG